MPLRQEPIEFVFSDPLMVAFQRTMSPARLQPYIEAAGFQEKRAIRLYLWNAAARDIAALADEIEGLRLKR